MGYDQCGVGVTDEIFERIQKSQSGALEKAIALAQTELAPLLNGAGPEKPRDCEDCEEPIPLARLEALPGTILCRGCKEARVARAEKEATTPRPQRRGRYRGPAQTYYYVR